jgi:8-oxo-dGTP pyrophosphatase MutT (NUDIX family)
MAARRLTTAPGDPGDRPPPAPAATLVALFEEGGEVRVILIRRSRALPVHAGEIGLPGGRVHSGEGMVDAALREAREEVGVAPEQIEVVGWLDPVVGRSSGSVALPIVGLLAARPALTPDAAEIEAIFDVALPDLLAEGVYREERWDVPVPDRAVHFFELPGVTVWGMTARALHQLLGLVTSRTGTPGQAPPPGQGGTTPPAPV